MMTAEILARRVRVFGILDAQERVRLAALVDAFIDDRIWEGCSGLEITEDVQVTIAGHACAMVLGADTRLLRELETILVYPTKFTIPRDEYIRRAPRNRPPAGERLAVALPRGPLIVAWDAVIASDASERFGKNVVVREVARYLDGLDRDYDGTPPLEHGARREWAATLQRAFADQRARVDRGEPAALPERALDSPTEFFARAAEQFFARPMEFAGSLPDVYARLAELFGLDLAAREPAAGPYR